MADMGKPNKGTRKDRRLKENKKKKSKSKKPFAKTKSADGRFPI
jgi:hypothetical protein